MEIVRHHDLEFHVQRHCGKSGPDLVLLHGFLGSGQQFTHLFPELSKVVNPVTMDIIPSHPEARLDAPSLVEGLQKTITRISANKQAPPWVLGYSMGGRLALSWAVRYAECAAGLILESTTAGIADPEQQALRREADAGRAQRIHHDFSDFLDEWEQNPLFRAPDASDEKGLPGKSGATGEADTTGEADKTDGTDSKDTSDSTDTSEASANKHHDKHSEPHNRLAAIQRSQDPEVMARWLRDFGTGSMPPLWDELHHINIPVLLVTGASDPKFYDLADQMARHLPNARHEMIPNAAHRVHVDNPAGYLSCLLSFLAEAGRTGSGDIP